MPATKKSALLAGAALALASVAAAAAAAAADAQSDPLKVCVAENNPPLSWKHGKNSGGFDTLLAQALAEHLQRPLKLVWFEPELDKDEPFSIGVNAMLSSGVCDLVSGYGLYGPALGAAGADTGKTLDYDGAPRKRERKPVKLGKLVASAPYMGSAMTVVLGPQLKGRRIESFEDIRDLRIGVTAGSLGGALVMMYNNGALRDKMHSVTVNGDVFAELESGKTDVVFAPLNKFDAYRIKHPDSALSASGYLHPLRFNLGFVALEENRPLLDEVNHFIAQAREGKRYAGWAQEAKLSYVDPVLPEVQPALSPMALAKYR